MADQTAIPSVKPESIPDFFKYYYEVVTRRCDGLAKQVNETSYHFHPLEHIELVARYLEMLRLRTDMVMHWNMVKVYNAELPTST